MPAVFNFFFTLHALINRSRVDIMVAVNGCQHQNIAVRLRDECLIEMLHGKV